MESLLHPGWFEALESISFLAFGIVFLAGFAMGIAPSSYALYPVIAGYVAGGEDRSAGRGLLLSLAFVFGSATVDAVLGALFGFVGGIVIALVARYLALWNLLAAFVLGLFGLALLRVVRVRWPVLRITWTRAHTLPGAYALGVPFGLTACPACTPMVLPMLGAAAATGTWWFGAALMFVFGVARGVPLLLVGTGAGLSGRLNAVARFVPMLEKASGWVLLLAGLFFLVQAVRVAWINYL